MDLSLLVTSSGSSYVFSSRYGGGLKFSYVATARLQERLLGAELGACARFQAALERSNSKEMRTGFKADKARTVLAGTRRQTWWWA